MSVGKKSLFFCFFPLPRPGWWRVRISGERWREKKGWKKDGKKAVIEAIQHWWGRHSDKLHSLPWLPVACVASLSCISPPPPRHIAVLEAKERHKGGERERRRKEAGVQSGWEIQMDGKNKEITRRRRGSYVKWGRAGDYGWKVDVLRQRQQANLAGSRASGRTWTRHRMRIVHRSARRRKRRARRSGMLTAGEWSQC